MNNIPKRIFWCLLIVAILLITFSLGVIFWSIIEVRGADTDHYIEPVIEKAEIKEAGILGIASWYNYNLPGYPGYSKDYRTCASRDYPRKTILIVVYQDRFTTCVVNDYGPAEWTGRDIDLSSLAFSDLAPLSKGILREVEIRERKIQ